MRAGCLSAWAMTCRWRYGKGAAWSRTHTRSSTARNRPGPYATSSRRPGRRRCPWTATTAMTGGMTAGGHAAAAPPALAGLLVEGPLPLPPARRGDAQARKAQLYLDANDAARALEWSDKALASCRGCAALPAIQILRGRAALAAGDPAAALDWAGKVDR